MKKINKISLCAAIALSSVTTTVSGSDTISDAFKNGKFKGEIKSVTSKSNFLERSSSDTISVIGGSFGYVTDDFNGLSVGATFQTSHNLAEDNDAANDVQGPRDIFGGDLDASGSVLSESYLNYKIANTSIKIGRQYIYTPLVSTGIDGKSSESLLKDSFEAYMITNTDISNTTLTAAYISKYQEKADGTGDVGTFDTYEDGAYTLYVKNNSIENVTLQGQFLQIDREAANTDSQHYYVQADYKMGHHTLSAQYMAANFDNKDDGDIYGVQATGPLGLGQTGYVLAFNASTKNGSIDGGSLNAETVGSGSTNTLFTSMPVAGGGVPARPESETLTGAFIIPTAGATVIPYIGYSWEEQRADTLGSGNVFGTGLIAIYPINKNLVVKANYEFITSEMAADNNTKMSKVYLTYKF